MGIHAEKYSSIRGKVPFFLLKKKIQIIYSESQIQRQVGFIVLRWNRMVHIQQSWSLYQ